MSTVARIRAFSSPSGIELAAEVAIPMEAVVAGPLQQLYAAGALRGPAEIQLSCPTALDGRLPDSHLSHAANDAEGGFAEDERVPVDYQGLVAVPSPADVEAPPVEALERRLESASTVLAFPSRH